MLFNTPIKINNMELQNRIVMAPMGESTADLQGHVTDKTINYYLSRAKGGFGLIETGIMYAEINGKVGLNQLSASKDNDIDGLSQLARAIHNNSNSKIIAQINHAGYSKNPATGGEIVAPSNCVKPWKVTENLPRAMTIEEIHNTVEYFAQAAYRLKKAGFDGVEFHSCHGNLLNMFYSPLTNKREDEYGYHTLENRVRIHKEIIKRARELCGRDFVMTFRLGCSDYYLGGTTIEESVQVAKWMQEWTADIISVTGGQKGYLKPENNEPGFFRDLSMPIKKAVDICVMGAGGVTNGQQLEQVLQDNVADIFGIGRQALKNPNFGNDVYREFGIQVGNEHE